MLKLLALAVALAQLQACALSGIDFFEDNRLSLIGPKDGEVVRLPVTVRWRTRDFDGLFAVFVDDARPMRPGKDLASLVDSDDSCHRERRCGDDAWLADYGVYVTDGSSVTIDQLPDRSGPRSDIDPHEITVVLLDRSGKRLSEATFYREFRIRRES